MTGKNPRGEILFLAHRTPFPPDRGDKIRSCNLLRALAKLAPVHVATFAEDDADLATAPDLAQITASHCLIHRTMPLPLAGLRALLRGQPVSLTAFADSKLREYVRQTLAGGTISTVVVFSSQMAQYVPRDFAGRVVMDFVDVDSAKFAAYADDAAWPMGLLHRREARLLGRFERQVARRADVSLFVTPQEIALFHDRAGPDGLIGLDIRALGNGVDAAFFDPATVVCAPEIAAISGPHFVFTGQMDYPPNVAAVERFATRILPAIRQVHRSACFHVVGRKPANDVRSLSRIAGCRVHGAVPDVRPWLTGADVVVAPLEIARGVQNKVLEAMAMARPVIASLQAATGIAAQDGQELVIADGDAQFAQAALDLLADPDQAAAMGSAARTFVQDRQSWEAMLAPLAEIVALPSLARSRRAA